MRRFKKVMLMTSVASGLTLAVAGSAQAASCDSEPPAPTIENAQFLDCEQEFEASLVTINAPVSVLGESVTNVGNFCTQVAPSE
ncbi:hypothetical protein ACFYOV_15620 [Streptomyces sp. NPDC005931]|uniref:hypothetical protein n=1 Tax=Streptomyces sp. NPDC005931 TaxID=3364737 RepID=UPI0036D01197